jgi:hypothetical protein
MAMNTSWHWLKARNLSMESCRLPPKSNSQNTTIDNISVSTPNRD